ncbi:hypothetical protein GW17_00008708 [Ensete ventricosum]|nr:hypothetical protein GW17_00008708 [Ensete ventricosum]
MLRSGLTQEWVDEGELPRERTKNRRWSKGARKRRRVRRGSATQKTKCWLERTWTRRSATVPQRQIYQSRRKGRRCKATDNRVMGLTALWYRRGGTSVESSISCSHGESIGRKRGRGGGECRGKIQVPRQDGRAEAKELHKTSVDGLLIKIAESEGLRIDAGVLDQGTK